MLRVECSCGNVWKVSDDKAGKKLKCPECDELVLAKRPSAVSTKPMPAARGDAAQVALRAGLVTAVKTRLEAEQHIIAMVGEDDTSGSFKSVSAIDYARRDALDLPWPGG